MTTAEKDNLAAALARAQGQLPKVGKGKTADAGQYSYRYADLADITAALLPVLAAEGLAWTAAPTLLDDGKFVLEYALLHRSGEQRGGRYPLPDRGNAQAMGSAITYARRYALCSVTGLAPDEDDDGKAAQQAAPEPQHAQRPPQSEADKLRNEIRALATERGWVLATVAQGYAEQYDGRPLKTETDTEALTLFLQQLMVDAAAEDDAAKKAS